MDPDYQAALKEYGRERGLNPIFGNGYWSDPDQPNETSSTANVQEVKVD